MNWKSNAHESTTNLQWTCFYSLDNDRIVSMSCGYVPVNKDIERRLLTSWYPAYHGIKRIHTMLNNTFNLNVIPWNFEIGYEDVIPSRLEFFIPIHIFFLRPSLNMHNIGILTCNNILKPFWNGNAHVSNSTPKMLKQNYKLLE